MNLCVRTFCLYAERRTESKLAGDSAAGLARDFGAATSKGMADSGCLRFITYINIGFRCDPVTTTDANMRF